MRRQFERGTFRTRNGYRAIVAQTSQVGPSWILRGAVECPMTGVLVMHSWSVLGSNVSDSQLDLSHEIKDEEQDG